jgi:hypothetical protein
VLFVKIIHHLKGLIFDCLSFTEVLFTTLPTVESEAPASSNTFATSLWPFLFYVMMTTEIFINYFCNIKLCCLWRFDGKYISVIYWEIICAKILFYIYCFRVRINILWFISITRLKQNLTRRVWYSNFLHFRWHSSFITWTV